MDTEPYAFDVLTSPHDLVKVGTLDAVRSRVLISRDYTYAEAMDLAACLAIACHGGMATAVLPRY